MTNSLVVVLLIVAKINILYLYDIYLNYTQNINPVIYFFSFIRDDNRDKKEIEYEIRKLKVIYSSLSIET